MIKTELKIQKVGGNIGAEISGISLQDDLAPDVVAAIRAALHAHKVVFFREQFELTDEGQFRFAARMGEVTKSAHPFGGSVAGKERISAIDSIKKGRTDSWHTDTTYVQRPPAGAVLRAVVLPGYGGDTLWANTAASYAAFPKPVQTMLDGMWGVHSNRWGYGHMRSIDNLPPIPGETPDPTFAGPPFEAVHPLVRVHPATGEKAILAGTHLRHIMGLSGPASLDMQRMIHDAVTMPENFVRWRWRLGDVAIWDNYATQHFACSDYDERRVMHRVSMAGEVPVAVDGQRSWTRVGDQSSYVD